MCFDTFASSLHPDRDKKFAAFGADGDGMFSAFGDNESPSGAKDSLLPRDDDGHAAADNGADRVHGMLVQRVHKTRRVGVGYRVIKTLFGELNFKSLFPYDIRRRHRSKVPPHYTVSRGLCQALDTSKLMRYTYWSFFKPGDNMRRTLAFAIGIMVVASAPDALADVPIVTRARAAIASHAVRRISCPPGASRPIRRRGCYSFPIAIGNPNGRSNSSVIVRGQWGERVINAGGYRLVQHGARKGVNTAYRVERCTVVQNAR